MVRPYKPQLEILYDSIVPPAVALCSVRRPQAMSTRAKARDFAAHAGACQQERIGGATESMSYRSGVVQVCVAIERKSTEQVCYARQRQRGFLEGARAPGVSIKVAFRLDPFLQNDPPFSANICVGPPKGPTPEFKKPRAPRPLHLMVKLLQNPGG